MVFQSQASTVLSTSTAVPPGLHLGEVGVQLIPAELWMEIFILGKRLDDTLLFGNSTPQSGHIDSVSAVSQTSSYFRQLAIEAPVLWTSIHIDSTRSVASVLRRIERSRPLTLDIAINLIREKGSAADLDRKNVDTFMDIVMDEIGRWRSLRVRIEVEQAAHPVIMRLRDNRALNLEYLAISVNAREPGETRPIPHILNYGAPKLVSAKLRGVAHTFYRPPLTDLVTLRLEGIGHLKMDFVAFVGVLSQPTRLRHLLIRRDIVREDAWAQQSPGSLPLRDLRSLHIHSESGAMYAGFLLAMDAPQLSALTLEGVFDHDLDDLWTRAPPQKFMNLTRLTFMTEEDISTTTYVKACRLFPNVTEYATQRVTPSNSRVVTILSGKIKQPNGEPFVGWPKLQSLRLAFDPSAESLEDIKQVTESRIRAGFALRQVCFFWSKTIGWMSEPDGVDKLAISLKIPVQLEGHVQVLPGDSNYIDVDDIVE